jgi:hypothetical protein
MEENPGLSRFSWFPVFEAKSRTERPEIERHRVVFRSPDQSNFTRKRLVPYAAARLERSRYTEMRSSHQPDSI